MNAGKLLREFPEADSIPNDDLLKTPCTVLVPAALERVITHKNASQIHCRVLAEAANGPTTPEADRVFVDSDLFIIPDVICNAGGVTVSYFEWVQDMQQFFWSEEQVNAKLEELMLKAFHRVRDLAVKRRLPMRMAALSLGVEKVAKEKLRRDLPGRSMQKYTTVPRATKATPARDSVVCVRNMLSNTADMIVAYRAGTNG